MSTSMQNPAAAPHDSDTGLIDRWLALETDRIWLLAERVLRGLQRARLRPAPDHASLVEVETILGARRAERLGAPSLPEDVDQLSRVLVELEARLFPLRRSVALGRLVTTFGLRPLEIEVLVTAVAQQVEPRLASMFAAIRTPARGSVDLSLLTTLLGLGRAHRVRLLDALDPDRPLLCWRLIQVTPADSVEAFGCVSYRTIRPTFDLVSGLCGRTSLAPEVSRVARLRIDRPTLDDLWYDDDMRREAQALCDAARAPSTHEAPWLVLWGPTGIGKRTLAARIAAHAGRPLVAFDPTLGDRASFADLAARVQREAMIRGAMLYVGPLSPELQEHGGRELFALLSRYRGPIALGIDDTRPPRLDAPHPIREIAMRLPSAPTRTGVWNASFPAETRGPDLNPAQLAQAFLLTPGEILATAHEAKLNAAREHVRVGHRDARGAIARRLRTSLGEIARAVTVTATWSDLVLPPQEMDRVSEFIARKKFADRVYNEWGYGARIGAAKGLTALFSGPPGTGKTMLAGLIAQSLDLDLYQVDLGQVVSKWVGETEKQLANVFDQAERAHAVLLFDEADSLFAKRTEVQGASDRYGNMVVNYLLQRLEQYSGVAILTTNHETSLDEALQRRLALHLFLEIPEIEERERLWQTFLPARAPVGRDFHALAEEFELSGGYIKNAAVRAAFLAAAHDVSINMELLRLASALELEDMGRVVWHAHEPRAPAA